MGPLPAITARFGEVGKGKSLISCIFLRFADGLLHPCVGVCCSPALEAAAACFTKEGCCDSALQGACDPASVEARVSPPICRAAIRKPPDDGLAAD